jgi:parallel beta-helix repeat protein
MTRMEMKRIGMLLIGLLAIVALSACRSAPNPAPTATAEPTEAPSAAPSDEIYVAVDGSGDYLTIEEAVAAAAPRATITLGPGTYRLVRGLEIKTSMRLVGAGMDETEIVSGAPSHVINFSGSGSFGAEGITFRHDGSQMADVVVVGDGIGDFLNCRFTGAIYEEGKGNRAGLRFKGSSRGTVEGCEAVDNDNTGFLVEQQAQPELRGNICSDNTVVGIGYMDLGRGLASENECTGNKIGIGVAVEAKPTLERNVCNDNDYGIAYVENGGGKGYGNICSNNKIGITVGASSTAELSDNDCRDNSEQDIRDSRQ